jgi:hypothetical protein
VFLTLGLSEEGEIPTPIRHYGPYYSYSFLAAKRSAMSMYIPAHGRIISEYAVELRQVSLE